MEIDEEIDWWRRRIWWSKIWRCCPIKIIETIIETILDSINEYNDGLSKNEQISSDLDSSIYGGSSNLDSMGLVSFIVGLEQSIEDKFDQSISLADEKAMSQKSSPYKNINSLADYILKLLVKV